MISAPERGLNGYSAPSASRRLARGEPLEPPFPKMPGQRGSETRKLSASVLVRLLPDEHVRLTELAEAEGLTLAAYARLRLAGGAKTPRPAQVVVNSNLDLIRELRRQGGLAKLAIFSREYNQEGRAALTAITGAISHLSRGIR